jgi:hypothetical protein
MTDAQADELFLEAIRAQHDRFAGDEWARIETLMLESDTRRREQPTREKKQEVDATLAADIRALLTPEQALTIDADVQLLARDLPIRQCARNLRSIGQAMHIHAAEHKGALPPDVGTLFADLDPRLGGLVLCPLSGKTLPAGFENLGVKERIDWINENTDYEYFGKDMNVGKWRPNPAVAQDKPGHKHPIMLGDHGEVTGKARINVLHMNGHVESVWE